MASGVDGCPLRPKPMNDVLSGCGVALRSSLVKFAGPSDSGGRSNVAKSHCSWRPSYASGRVTSIRLNRCPEGQRLLKMSGFTTRIVALLLATVFFCQRFMIILPYIVVCGLRCSRLDLRRVKNTSKRDELPRHPGSHDVALAAAAVMEIVRLVITVLVLQVVCQSKFEVGRDVYEYAR